MRLKELLLYIVDEVCIYAESRDGEYVDLFIGRLENSQPLLLEKKVRLIGAKRKNMLDIQVWN